jgi:hypothetical protein
LCHAGDAEKIKAALESSVLHGRQDIKGSGYFEADDAERKDGQIVRLACLGAFFAVLALTGPASPMEDVVRAAARLKEIVSAMDGNKVCQFGTCARPHPSHHALRPISPMESAIQ